MIIPIKTLKQLKTGESSFVVDIEQEKTVGDLKSKIEDQCGKEHFPAQDQTLIYGGKILQNADKIDDCKIDQKKFVVLMVNRPLPPPSNSSSITSSTSTTLTSNKQDSNTNNKPAQARPQTQTSARSSTQPSTQTQAQPQQTATSQARVAPVAQSPAQQAANTQNQPPNREFSDATRVLSSQPQFRQLQNLVQQNPHLLSSTIEALAESNPDLYHFISVNPDAFVSALNQPIVERQRTNPLPTTQGGGTTGGGGAIGGGGGVTTTAAARSNSGILDLISNITQQDKEAIGRLKELGFSEDMAAQAYMACNKDEQLAANLLFQMDQ